MRITTAALLLVFSTVACDQLTATEQAVSVLTKTPALSEVEGIPTQLLTVLEDSASGVELGSVFALAALTERDSVTDTTVSPLTGASVELEGPTSVVTLCELTSEAPGTYAVSTATGDPCNAAGLSYVEGARYVTAIETTSERYTLTMPDAPAPVDTVDFSPAFGTANQLGFPTHPSATALTVDWSNNPGELDGFVTVFRIEYLGATNNPLDATVASNWQADSNNPVFDNFPRSGGEALDFALGDPVTSVTIPASNLSATGLYVLLVTAVELSDDVSSNLSLGSYAIAGAGRSWAFWVD